MKEVLIDVEGLCRTYKVRVGQKGFLKRLISNEYKEIKAVDDVSFKIKKGEIVGFIGPNGAGKSTTIKMLTGILVPTNGTIAVLGREPYKFRKENAKDIGVVFGQRTQLWWDLPLADTFKLLKSIYQIPNEIYNTNLEFYMKKLGIESFYNQPVRQLSLGQRMRGEITAAMLHNPKILFLDEPTIGLDIVVKQQLYDFIRQINEEREITVILTTHDMKDIEVLCDRLIMINNGKVIIDMSIDEVKGTFNDSHDITITFSKIPEYLPSVAGCEIIRNDNHKYVFRIKDSQIKISEFLMNYITKCEIQDISIRGMNIEDIVRQMYIRR